MSKYKTLTLSSFTIGDIDEPDLYIGFEVDRILNSELGEWLGSIGSSVYTHRIVDHDTMIYKVRITARMSEENAVYYKLKWR